MKKFLKLKSFLLLTVLCSVFVSCSDDDNDPDPNMDATNTIVELAQASNDLSTLVAALDRADLVSTLAGDGNFTVLAPTNAAFDAFLADKGFATLEDVPTEVLEQILLGHVIAGNAPLTAGDLTALGAGYANTAAAGIADGTNISLYFDTSSGVTFNGGPSVSSADNFATNGVVHIIDAVIDIPTVVTFVQADPRFETLLSALTELTPDTDFAATLSTANGTAPAPFTVFAPTDEAFAKLDAIPAEDTLTPILQHHVVAGANVRSGDLTPDGTTNATTLEGDDIAISLPGITGTIANVVDGAGNTGIGIVAVDIQAGNGVIHVLDTVLIPNLDN